MVEDVVVGVGFCIWIVVDDEVYVVMLVVMYVDVVVYWF